MAECLSTHTRMQRPLWRSRGRVSQIVHLRAQKHSGNTLPPGPAFLCCSHTHLLCLNLSHTFTCRFMILPSLSFFLRCPLSSLSLSLSLPLFLSIRLPQRPRYRWTEMYKANSRLPPLCDSPFLTVGNRERVDCNTHLKHSQALHVLLYPHACQTNRLLTITHHSYLDWMQVISL